MKRNQNNETVKERKVPVWIHILTGRFLHNERVIKQLPFLGFLYMLIIVYIALGYYAEGLVKKINRADRDVKELRSEFISKKSELMQISKQTTLAKVLNQQQTGIKETVNPPKKIVVQK